MLYVYHQVYQPILSVDGKTVTLVHFGEYKYLCEAYNAITRFMKDKFLVAKDGVSIQYVKNERNTVYSERYITVLTAKVEKAENHCNRTEDRAYA